MEIISRKEARRQGLTRYFTGKPCVHGHLAERSVHTKMCNRCKQNRTHRDRRASPEAWAKHRVNIHRSGMKRLAASPQLQAAAKLRQNTYWLLRKRAQKGKYVEILGCTGDEFAAYLEALFLPGMVWGNYGRWEIDHVKPLSLFDLTDPKQLAVAGHHTNCQPLWREDNVRKGAQYPNAGAEECVSPVYNGLSITNPDGTLNPGGQAIKTLLTGG